MSTTSTRTREQQHERDVVRSILTGIVSEGYVFSNAEIAACLAGAQALSDRLEARG